MEPGYFVGPQPTSRMRGKASPAEDFAVNFQFLTDAKKDAANKIAQARGCKPVLFARRLSDGARLDRTLDFGYASVHGANGEFGLLFVNQQGRAEPKRGVTRTQNEQALVKRHLHQAVAQVRRAFFGLLI